MAIAAEAAMLPAFAAIFPAEPVILPTSFETEKISPNVRRGLIIIIPIFSIVLVILPDKGSSMVELLISTLPEYREVVIFIIIM